MIKKRALITGVNGQDGAYLAQLLLEKNYKVFGTYRRTASLNFWRLEELNIEENDDFQLLEYDITDQSNALKIVAEVKPDEIYNLAAQSFLGVSNPQPVSTTNVTGLGCVHLLEAIRIINPKIKFYQASTSEMFGLVSESPQNELTPFYPRNSYGIAKLYAHWMTVNYKETYGIFAASGILYNHESPLRGKEFVTRKITDSVSKIKLGKLEYFELGNLDAKRDWGYAKEYVEGMYLMLQAKVPDTFILSTNKVKTVREFVKESFKIVGIEIIFKGSGINEIGIDKNSGKTLVKVNEKFYRKTEPNQLIGDSNKALKLLGWKTNVTFEELCKIMVIKDLERNKNGFNF